MDNMIIIGNLGAADLHWFLWVSYVIRHWARACAQASWVVKPPLISGYF